MLPTTLVLYLATQITLAPSVAPSCGSGFQWNAANKSCEVQAKNCGSRAAWDRSSQSCQTLPPTREQCWSDGQELDPASRSCVPVQLTAFCREHNWDYDQEHTVSRILNDLGAHDCEEAQTILRKTHKLTLQSSGYLKIQDLRPLRALPYLEELNLDGQSVSDLSPLQKLSHLRKLSLRANAVFDVSPLLSLSHLESLDLSGNPLNPADPNVKALQKKMRVTLRPSVAETAADDTVGSIVEAD